MHATCYVTVTVTVTEHMQLRVHVHIRVGLRARAQTYPMILSTYYVCARKRICARATR